MAQGQSREKKNALVNNNNNLLLPKCLYSKILDPVVKVSNNDCTFFLYLTFKSLFKVDCNRVITKRKLAGLRLKNDKNSSHSNVPAM